MKWYEQIGEFLKKGIMKDAKNPNWMGVGITAVLAGAVAFFTSGIGPITMLLATVAASGVGLAAGGMLSGSDSKTNTLLDTNTTPSKNLVNTEKIKTAQGQEVTLTSANTEPFENISREDYRKIGQLVEINKQLKELSPTSRTYKKLEIEKSRLQPIAEQAYANVIAYNSLAEQVNQATPQLKNVSIPKMPKMELNFKQVTDTPYETLLDHALFDSGMDVEQFKKDYPTEHGRFEFISHKINEYWNEPDANGKTPDRKANVDLTNTAGKMLGLRNPIALTSFAGFHKQDYNHIDTKKYAEEIFENMKVHGMGSTRAQLSRFIKYHMGYKSEFDPRRDSRKLEVLEHLAQLGEDWAGKSGISEGDKEAANQYLLAKEHLQMLKFTRQLEEIKEHNIKQLTYISTKLPILQHYNTEIASVTKQINMQNALQQEQLASQEKAKNKNNSDIEEVSVGEATSAAPSTTPTQQSNDVATKASTATATTAGV